MPHSDGPFQYAPNNASFGNRLKRYSPDRDIFGRSGRVFLQEVLKTNAGNNTLGSFRWLANVTNVSANLSFEKVEVKMAGERVVRYKSAAVTGEGSLTYDKVNSYFEQVFLKHYRKVVYECSQTSEPEEFFLTISLEDPGIPNIEYDDTTGLAESGHEEIILMNVQFWNLPLGYDTTEVVTQDLDFTFQGIEFGSGGTRSIDEDKFNFSDLIKFIC